MRKKKIRSNDSATKSVKKSIWSEPIMALVYFPLLGIVGYVLVAVLDVSIGEKNWEVINRAFNTLLGIFALVLIVGFISYVIFKAIYSAISKGN